MPTDPDRPREMKLMSLSRVFPLLEDCDSEGEVGLEGAGREATESRDQREGS